MESFLRIALPIYFLCYITFLVVIRAFAVSRKIGKSPVVLDDTGNKFSRINKFFKLLILSLLIYLVIYAFFPATETSTTLHYYPFYKMPVLDNDYFKIAGLALLVISFVIVFFAQIHMHNSFRIGIDHDTRTELISGGLFRYSRNPIYVGLFASILGLFLVTPNIFTASLMVIASILIPVQVRLEEEYLFKMHGQEFLDYKKKVRRFL